MNNPCASLCNPFHYWLFEVFIFIELSVASLNILRNSVLTCVDKLTQAKNR